MRLGGTWCVGWRVLGFGATVLGGSWVVITGVISPLMWVVSIVTSLVTSTWASKY